MSVSIEYVLYGVRSTPCTICLKGATQSHAQIVTPHRAPILTQHYIRSTEYCTLSHKLSELEKQIVKKEKSI